VVNTIYLNNIPARNTTQTKYDRVAPPCPLCSKPIAIPPNEDPNIKMSRHIETDCATATGKSPKASSTTPRCENPKCKKILFASIKCDTCKHSFCPEHRFPSAHRCLDAGSTPAPRASSITPQTSVKEATEKLTPQAIAGLAAMKRAMDNAASKAKSSATKTSKPSPLGGSSKPSNPLTTMKTDRWVQPHDTQRDDDSATTPLIPSSSSYARQLSCKSESLESMSQPSKSWHPPPLFATA